MPLIGNTHQLAFEFHPISPTWERRYAPERTAWATLGIWVNGENLCRHVPAGSSTVREGLNVPLAPLADWIVRNGLALEFEERAARFPTSVEPHLAAQRWAEAAEPEGVDELDWFESREMWWSRHFLQAAADGAVLPNMALVRAGESVVVSWKPPALPLRDCPVMLNPFGEASVAWDDARDALGSFVGNVAKWLRDAEADPAYEWARQLDPLGAQPAAPEQALEFFTGRRVEDLASLWGVQNDAVFSILELDLLVGDPTASPAGQILRDCSPDLSADAANVIREVTEKTRSGNSALVASIRATGQDAARSARDDEAAGKYAARAVRAALDLNASPVASVSELLERLGADYEHLDVPGMGHRMFVAHRADGGTSVRILETVRTRVPWGRRFEKARSLGELTLDPLRSRVLGAASGPFAQASRRRRSGAFAAEFLLPAEAVEAASGRRLDGAVRPQAFARMLDEYQVGATTAAWQLWNSGWLSSPVLRDELIDEFTNRGR